MAHLALNRLGLKRQREQLARFERFLPALKLRQQQLQLRLRQAEAEGAEVRARLGAALEAFDAHRPVLGDLAGMDLVALAEPAEVRVGWANVAGVPVPVLEAVRFRDVAYSLFATPPWVDRVMVELRALSRYRAELEVLERQRTLLGRELVRVVQRVNLFEKVKVPEARRAIQRIRIHLGDEMAAAVGRSKIAKARLVVGSRADGAAIEGAGWAADGGTGGAHGEGSPP
jgi:V/A-type H+/Na+-transporting ATPase subunit D